MNNTIPSKTPLHVTTIWRLLIWHIAVMIIFALGLIVSFESMFRQMDEYRLIRIGLWTVTLITLFIVIGFVHYYLLRQALRYHRVADADDQRPSQLIMQDVWLELIHYPYRVVSYLVILSFGFMIVMNSVYHVLIGASFGQGLTSMLFVTFFLSLWIGPLAVLMYVKSESVIRRICPLVFKAEQWWLIDFSDTRHHLFNFRFKYLIIIIVPLICFLTSLILVLSQAGTFMNPVVIGLFLLVIVYYVVLIWMVSGSAVEPVRAMESVLDRLIRRQKLSPADQNDLISYTRDEIGKLNHAVFQLCRRIIPSLNRFQEGQNEMADQLEDISSVCRHQYTVSYSQASALSELAATMEEIVQSVNQVSSDAMRTSQMTHQGLNEIEQGKKYLEQTLDSIDQIHQESLASSQRIMDLSLKMVQIEDVVRIINYVTDHTKILAFNAAIETASAGEVGERFGVVAKEIRQLAQNISDSTEEIKIIINDVKKTAHASVITTEKELKQVNASIRNASDAQKVFTDIHTVIKQATDAVSNISAAINQQRVVHEQVWSSIKDIDSSAKELLKKSQKIVEVTDRLKHTMADHQTFK